LLSSCSRNRPQSYPFHYNLSAPDEHLRLPKKLREISGIDVYKGDNIVAVQDERGKVYVYNVKNEKLQESVGFADDHDYEAIAAMDDTVFVLRSNGTLYEILKLDSIDQQSIEFENSLSKQNNTEGLCYDKENHRLLIACKGAAHKGRGKKARLMSNFKAIYSFDLATHTLDEDPAYLIDIDEVKEYINRYNIGNDSLSQPDSVKLEMEDRFAPSEIAIHPITHDLYVLCSRGKLLIVLGHNGSIKYIRALDHRIFRQPEGITFYPNGDMLISDEGKEHRADILKFIYR
jgi:hypothetical protein